MVVVALAGVAKGFGLTLLDTILASGKHEVHLLSRSEKPDLTSRGVRVHIVDYSDIPSLSTALRGVHTLISTIGTMDTGDAIAAHRALLSACQTAGVRRFAPSYFAGPSDEGIDAYEFKRLLLPELRRASAASGLEFTRFVTGVWMNFLATGTPKPEGEEYALAGMRPWSFCVNFKAGTVDFPGDGRARLGWSEIRDVCRFVTAALELEKWDEVMACANEVASFEEIVCMAEKVTGRTYLRKQNTIEEMEKMAEVPEKRFYNQVRVVIAKGGMDFEPDLNQKFPDIKPVSIEGLMRKWWDGVEMPTPAFEEDVTFG